MQLSSGAFVIRIKYFKRRPNRPGGFYWYARRIPKDVLHHFRGQTFKYDDQGWIQKALGTNDEKEAIRRHAVVHAEVEKELDLYRKADGAKVVTKSTFETAFAILSHLDLKPADASTEKSLDRHPEEAKSNLLRFYDYLGSKYGTAFHEAFQREPRDFFILKLLDVADREAYRLLVGASEKPQVYLSDALSIYLKNHEKGDLRKFEAPVRQAYDKACSVIGDLPLSAIDRTKAHAIRDAMLNSGNKTTSVKRRIGVLCAIVNAAIEEHALDYRNPFEKLPIPRLGNDKTERDDFTHEELRILAKACVELNDTPRHIVAALIDTGARLSEIVGLRRQDIHLDHDPPYIVIRETKGTERTLKTKYSTRNVPLVGMALWSLREALRQTNSDWIFSRYASAEKVNANSASAAINAWLRPMFTGNKPAHSLRHTMETRLREKDTPENIMLSVGGWGDKTVARGYGKPHPVSVTVQYLAKVAIDPHMST